MADEIEGLIRDLGKIPKELKRELRPGLRQAAKPVLDQARLNASWSTRIPKATRISLQFAGRTPGVSIVTNVKKAPHARPYENQGEPGTFRAPLFGDREHWYPHTARPFLYPAVVAKAPGVERDIAHVVDRVTRIARFR
jgi:hypothetical protein